MPSIYTATLKVESVREKTITADNGTSTLYELTLRDQRPKKDPKESYCAFRFKTTFWNTSPEVEEGELMTITGDMVSNYYQDKDNNLKSEPVLRNPMILQNLGKLENVNETPEIEDDEIAF